MTLTNFFYIASPSLTNLNLIELIGKCCDENNGVLIDVKQNFLKK